MEFRIRGAVVELGWMTQERQAPNERQPGEILSHCMAAHTLINCIESQGNAASREKCDSNRHDQESERFDVDREWQGLRPIHRCHLRPLATAGEFLLAVTRKRLLEKHLLGTGF